ncbi:armadillo-type protein [Tirmania nivea]|nr:armadillo-type protein [Tirmania nivea]
MASSLAQQLQRIAAASVNTVSAERQKQLHSVSLLYTPGQASTQDLTTIYSIAVEGFRELVELDPALRKYERSLFSPSSISVDRFVQTKADNLELDRSIDDFLGLIGPRLLLKSAIKALEWLVRKFRIHEQNTTSLLLTFLPYHGHPVFTRIISIIPPKSLPITLSFLAPYISPPTCPPRASIIKSLTAHPDFFSLLTTHVLGVLSRNHAHHVLVSFYIAVTVETLNRMCTLATYRKNPEDIIIKVMPTLIQGLKAQKNPEFQIGCYMIITVLVAKLPLDDKLLDSLMAGVIEGWSKVSVSPALACVALLAQERTSRKPLPLEAVKGLLKLEGLGQMLVEMGTKYRVDELAAGLAIGILSQKRAFDVETIRLVEKILLELNMPYARRKDVLVKLIQATTKANFENEDVRTEVAEFFVRLAEGSKTRQAAKILHSLLQSEGLDIETLELSLQTVIKQAPAAIEAPVGNAPAVTASTLKGPKEIFQDLLSSLPKDTTETSFLAPSSSPLLPVLSQAFLQASSLASNVEMNKLFGLPLFSKRPANEAFTLTFLIKIWTSSTYPVLSRAAALSQANKIIGATTAANIKVDYQALLPYVLIALADQRKKVRAEAANVLISLNACLKHVESLRKKDKSIPMQVWAFETLFGKDTKQTGDVKWMETTEARKLVRGLGIVDTLEEAVVDGAVIYRTVAHGLGRDGEGMKNGLKGTAMAFLASHVIATSDLSTKLQLLKLVNTIVSGAAAKAKPAVTILRDWVDVEDYTISRVEACAQDKVDAMEMEKEIVCSVGKFDKGEGVELLVNIIKGEYGVHPNKIGGMRKVSCVRLREIWSALKGEVKTIAAQRLLDVSTESEEEEIDISGEAMDVLRNVNIPMEVFEQWLQESLIALKGWTANLGRGPVADNDTQAAKRARANSSASPVGISINRLTVVLELLESRSVGEKDVGLLKLGFGILGEVMNVASEIGVGIGYLLQLILGILSSIVNYIKNSDSPKRKLDGSIRADVLVNCIRSTQSPQVQNRALLLVAALADVAPEIVLHSVMPIFTFMGANVLRQDDEYSAHVIEQTVQRVIPPLVKSLHRQAQASSAVGIVAGVAELVSSFVTAYIHIPVHRRSRLFIKLTDTLGADEFLYVILAMLAEKYFEVGQSSGLGAIEKDQEIVTFGKGVANAFGGETQLLAVVNYLDIIKEVLQNRPEGVSSYIFDNIKEVTTETRATIALKLLRMLASVLDSEKLRTQVGRRLGEGDMDSERIRSYFTSALENLLALGSEYSDGNLHNVLVLVMENLLGLLSTPEFVKVIETLITNSQFRRSALATFKERVASDYRADGPSRLAVLGITPKIAAILTSNECPVELKADALSCITTITTKYGKRQPDVVFDLAQTVIGEGALRNADQGLRVMALVCLTDMTACLAGRILPIIPKTVPFSLELLETGGVGKSLVHNAVFVFLEALVNTIPSFMSSYLQKMLKGAWASTIESEADVESDDEDEIEVNTDAVTRELRAGLLDMIAKKMDVKAVIGAMAATWTDAVKLGSAAVKEHLATLKSLLSTANKSQVQKMHPLLTGFFLQAFDIRKQVLEKKQEVDIDESEVDEIEELCLTTALQMVMKLNDTIFKPMFLKFSDWAADEFKVEVDMADRDVLFQRSIIFYNWLNLLSENLKSLVTEYYSFILTSSISLLTTALSPKDPPSPHSITAFLSVLRALTTSFTTDTRDFWTSPVHFNQLSPVLLSSLSLVPLSPLLATPLTTAIVELASSCASSEDQLKAINTAVLKVMRSESVEVRLAAVKVEMKLYEKMGEEWLGLLPETVPYIAELLEDDSDEVERETQRLIGKIEEFLGEGELQGMLQ